MRLRLTPMILSGILGLTGAAWAQEEAKADHDHDSIKKEDVKTWTMQVDGKEYEVRPATPSYDGDTGLFHMSTAYTLPKGKGAFSVFRDNLDRDPGDVDISTWGISLAYGATSRLEVFGNFGIQNRVDADHLEQDGFINDYPFILTPWQSGVGDVKLGAKYKFLDDYRHDPVGLALRAYVKLPTADEQKGLGTGKTSFGGDLVLSKNLNHNADIHASIGYQVNSDPDLVKIGNAFKWGIGLNVPACKKLQLHVEATGSVYSDAAFDQTSPIDIIIGPVYWFKPGVFIRPALSWNAGFDDRGLNSSFKSYAGKQISVGYHPGTPCREVVAPPPPPPPPQNHPPTASCDLEKSQILPGETVRCRATASDPDGDPLTYTWRASAGSVSGSGSTATYDSTGVAAGTDVTITVSVSDGKGGVTESTCRVRVAAPDRKPEAQPCTSGGFPRNLARLNNVDKACLDDVASRLRQDPRSRVIIVGHADKLERYPDVIGRKRAEAVKTYLVKERGVDEARITVRSAGASKLLDTGTSAASRAKNRRVDVIFVPEGAAAPEDDD